MKMQKLKPIHAKCWDGAFRKITVLDLVEPGAFNATVKVGGVEFCGYYTTDPTPLFVKL